MFYPVTCTLSNKHFIPFQLQKVYYFPEILPLSMDPTFLVGYWTGAFQAHLRTHNKTHYDGIAYLRSINNISLDSISSKPTRVCFCNGENKLDCNYRPPSIEVQKGETFNVTLAAVDHVNHVVNADVISFLISPECGFGEGQQTQKVNTSCKNLTYNVFSPNDFETITVYADGPCGSSPSSLNYLKIQFLNCSCSIGFEPASSKTTCACNYDSKLYPYINKCNYTTKTLLRLGTHSWIAYINRTDPPGYVIHPNCPFDYCYPSNKELQFSLLNGRDAQCAYNRAGVLCGACQQGFSLSLGSSLCMHCQSYWPATLTAIIIATFITGILLVVTLLILNITVSVGMINGVIFLCQHCGI